MIEAGSQCYLCDLPVRFDTYKGCSHACAYCFTQRKMDISKISKQWGAKALRSFIEWKRNQNVARVDRNIPIHRGGLSDPFQPVEKKVWASLEALKVFAETQYPFVVSTKGRLIGDPEYFDLLKKCNCVLQISLVSPKYDKIEMGAPTRAERLELIRKLSPHIKRVIVRVQPYTTDVKQDILKQIPMYKEAWVYGLIFEWMKMFKKTPELVKIWWDFCYPRKVLERDFLEFKSLCHKNGMKFYSGENRLRSMGDSLTCCGIDWLDRTPHTYNLNHYLYDKENFKSTPWMDKPGSAIPFKALQQMAEGVNALRQMTFKEAIDICTKDKWMLETFLSKE